MADPAVSSRQSQALLGRICEQLDRVRALIGESSAKAEAERILAGLRNGDEITHLEAQLHRLLRRHGVASGLTGITRSAGIGGLPGLQGHPVGPEVLVCPRGRCPRTVLRSDPPDVPRDCRLHGEPLRPVHPGP